MKKKFKLLLKNFPTLLPIYNCLRSQSDTFEIHLCIYARVIKLCQQLHPNPFDLAEKNYEIKQYY